MSRTYFVVSANKVSGHVGEEYDAILEVEDQPTTRTIQDWANRIKDGIRGLWHDQVKPTDPNATAVNPKVVVHLDAASPYSAILLNLQVIMKGDEGIDIELPFFKKPEVNDPEAVEMLKKLEGK